MIRPELCQRDGRIPILRFEPRQRCRSRQFRSTSTPQSGQAALEAMIIALALAVLWVGVAWLGRIQDLALHASHAARYSVFMASRDDTATATSQVRTGGFTGKGNQWVSLRGDALQASVYQTISVSLARGNPIAFDAQAGGADPNSAQLRTDWGIADRGVLSAQVSLAPSIIDDQDGGRKSLLKLVQFEAAYPKITRNAAILTGAGHAGSDTLTAERIAQSDLGWFGPADFSFRSGRRVASVASKVDAAWGRPDPVFDWLGPWVDQVPVQHLRK